MKINVKSAPKKFEPKTIEITVETFEELKALRDGFSGLVPAASPYGRLYKVVAGQYRQALDNGEVDCDF